MPTLDYQDGDEARKENSKRTRLKWFGPSQADVWTLLAADVGGRFQKGKWFAGDRVDVSHGPWQLVLDTYVVSTGKSATFFTRMRAPYVNADNFRFNIFRKHFFSAIAEKLGFQDVEVGYKEFDEEFIIRGNDDSKLKRLFANQKIRELLEQQPKVRFEVKDDEGGFFTKKFPEGVDELLFTVHGIIKDLDQLKLLYELFAETLDELCRMGSAYEREPDVKI